MFVLQLCKRSNVSNKGLIDYLQKIIKGTRGISEAHTMLMGDYFNKEKTPGINGIGTKIASMLLRDIVVIENINVNRDDHRYLLQPVDEWVKRAILHLTNKPPSGKFNYLGCILAI